MKNINLFIFALLLSASFIKAQNSVRMTSFYDVNDKKSYYIVLDIKTGKSLQYFWNGSVSKWESFKINIPEKPLLV